MKKLLLAAAFGFVAVTASAQTTSSASSQEVDKSVHFGVRVGLNVSKITSDWYGDYAYGEGDLKSRAGFHIGVIADVPLVKNYFYVTPGLYFTQKGGKYTYEDRDDEWDEWEKDEQKYNPMYLEIPILFSGRYTFGIAQLQVNFGPYFAVGLAGKFKRTDTDHWGGGTDVDKYKSDIFKKYDTYKDEDLDDNDGNGCGYKRFDAGLSFGVGVTLAKHYYVGIQYELGLVDYYNSDLKKEYKEEAKYDGVSYKSTKNKNFMVTVGYNF
ncbi:MAG: PorT family protein [Prevotellaceae bacterium]|nr:PorT family protein [Prevotellaceae bacterium]